MVVLQMALILTFWPAYADSSSPLLSAYYDRQMAIVNGVAYTWEDTDKPEKVIAGAVQVGVGRDRYYVLTGSGELLSYRAGHKKPIQRMTGVAKFAAGQSGVLSISSDHVLWWLDRSASEPVKIDDGVVTAAVGDGANYYVTQSESLFVKGKAHRGQYGDGRLKPTKQYVQTASGVAEITAHTGHAILLKTNGDVFGTGGNIYGPVGRHGLGDKAVKWSRILADARAIATGSSHSAAIRNDHMLMLWGRGYAIEPVAVMGDVIAVATGLRTTLALRRDGSLWQWQAGNDPTQVKFN